MCVVSNIGDMGRDMWPNPFPVQPYQIPGKTYPFIPGKTYPVSPVLPYNGPTKEQFEEFLEMMRAAKRLDNLTGAADCEDFGKTGWMKSIGDHLGVYTQL